MSFTFAPAVRDRVGLLIGLAGASGSGKTLSAFKLARGLAGGDDSKIAVVDTEGGRAKHYAPAPGDRPGENTFGFAHGDLKPPFQPEAYLAAINAADEAGFEVIVLDSFSHVWDGVGGMQDMHDAAVDAVVARRREQAQQQNWRNFDEVAEGEKASIGAWREPKMRNKRLVARLLQCRAHLIICMRADEKMRMEQVEVQKENGRGSYKKTVITAAKDLPIEERWVPIVEKRFPYELTTSLLLTPASPGVPIPIKLQQQHRAAVPLDQPLGEEVGRALAAWARGETLTKAELAPASTTRGQSGRERLYVAARAAADKGAAALQEFRDGLTSQQNDGLKPILDDLISRVEAASRYTPPADTSDGFPGDEALERLRTDEAA